MLACTTDAPSELPDRHAEILMVEAPSPILEGSPLLVTGLDFDTLGTQPALQISTANGTATMLPLRSRLSGGQLVFGMTAGAITALGVGRLALEATLVGESSRSDNYPFTGELASELPLSLSEGLSGIAHRNDLAVLRGSGLTLDGEGTTEAHFVGTFTPEGRDSAAVDVELPVLAAERLARDRGIVRLSTALGGIWPGRLEGTVALVTTRVTGAELRSSSMPVDLEFSPPDLFAVDPTTASLEQIISVRGAGFVGGPDEPDEATFIRLTGELTPHGSSSRTVGPVELVLEFVSGTEMRGVLRAEQRRGRLISQVFGVARGVFAGQAAPVVIKGTDEVEGAGVPFTFTLEPIRQVVQLRFLPGFYDSLHRFGLGDSAGTIEGLIAERIEGIYEDWDFDVRLDRPEDYSPNGYAVVEIGGPDPNGVGLFGYDNTPGKDVGNLRLFDAIGGANADTQADGYPGYGGVFVETMLYFSSRPSLPGRRPPGAPRPDPLFDEIFDPVRVLPAQISEIRGEGDPSRVAEVRRAIRALASMVGETSAHELGHSLGLAEPYGPPTVFHNSSDRDGCLMDSGGARPLGERTAQDGFASTRICGDGPEYLDEIMFR